MQKRTHAQIPQKIAQEFIYIDICTHCTLNSIHICITFTLSVNAAQLNSTVAHHRSRSIQPTAQSNRFREVHLGSPPPLETESFLFCLLMTRGDWEWSLRNVSWNLFSGKIVSRRPSRTT